MNSISSSCTHSHPAAGQGGQRSWPAFRRRLPTRSACAPNWGGLPYLLLGTAGCDLSPSGEKSLRKAKRTWPRTKYPLGHSGNLLFRVMLAPGGKSEWQTKGPGRGGCKGGGESTWRGVGASSVSRGGTASAWQLTLLVVSTPGNLACRCKVVGGKRSNLGTPRAAGDADSREWEKQVATQSDL